MSWSDLLTEVTCSPRPARSMRSCSAARSMRLSSWVPAWATASSVPSREQATPAGLAAPRSMSSSSTVAIRRGLCGIDHAQRAGVHPAAVQLGGRQARSGRACGRHKRSGRPAETVSARASVDPLGRRIGCGLPLAVSITLSSAAISPGVGGAGGEQVGHEQGACHPAASAAATGSRIAGKLPTIRLSRRFEDHPSGFQTGCRRTPCRHPRKPRRSAASGRRDANRRHRAIGGIDC